MDYKPASSSDSEETEIAEETEGKLDSIGRLFLDLLNENTPKVPSTDNPSNIIPDPASDPAPADAPAPQTQRPLPRREPGFLL